MFKSRATYISLAISLAVSQILASGASEAAPAAGGKGTAGQRSAAANGSAASGGAANGGAANGSAANGGAVKNAGAAANKNMAAGKNGDPINEYVKLVSPKVQQAWKVPNSTTAQKVVVSLTILQDGTISAVTIKEPSGDQAFDDATIASMKNIGKLPTMPTSAKNGMTLGFTFHAGDRNQANKSDHETYIQAFSRKVNSKWKNPKVDKNYQVTVAITADKSGKLLKAELSKPSGNKIVDDAGLNAAKLAEPYPPMPDSMSDKITVTYTFQAGPGKDVVNKMLFNGVPLPK